MPKSTRAKKNVFIQLIKSMRVLQSGHVELTIVDSPKLRKMTPEVGTFRCTLLCFPSLRHASLSRWAKQPMKWQRAPSSVRRSLRLFGMQL